MSKTPETVATIAAGLDSLAARLSANDRRGPMIAASRLSPSLPGVLRRAVAAARSAVVIATAGSAYDKPMDPVLGAASAAVCEAIGIAMRHLGSAMDAAFYQDRLQMSQAATVMHNVFAQFSGPLRFISAYSSLDEVYGATMSSNALGGRPLSPLRSKNAFAHLMEASSPQLRAVVSTEASQSISLLMRSDPVLMPMAVSEVSTHLSAIADGVRFS